MTHFTELALGKNPSPKPPLLVQSIGRVLHTTPRLRKLQLEGSASFRLREQLPALLGLVVASGVRLTELDISSHHAGDALVDRDHNSHSISATFTEDGGHFSQVDAVAPLLSGRQGVRALLLHENQMTSSALELLGHLMNTGGARGARVKPGKPGGGGGGGGGSGGAEGGGSTAAAPCSVVH